MLLAILISNNRNLKSLGNLTLVDSYINRLTILFVMVLYVPVVGYIIAMSFSSCMLIIWVAVIYGVLKVSITAVHNITYIKT